MIDATHLKAHRTPASLRLKKGQGPHDRPKKGGRNTKLHAVTDALDRPVRLFMTAGKTSDYTVAQALLDDLPSVEFLLADPGYGADWLMDQIGKYTRKMRGTRVLSIEISNVRLCESSFVVVQM